MTEAHDQWSRQAEYDLATACDMLKAGRSFYVLFCSQQSVEKMLKAVYARKQNETPPRTHHLVRIAEEAGLELSGEQKDFMRELTAYYVQSRYPGEIDDMESSISVDLANSVLQRTQELLQWLRSNIQ